MPQLTCSAISSRFRSRVLFNWRPAKPDTATLEREFLELVSLLGFEYEQSERSPAVVQYDPMMPEFSHSWHRDCSGLYFPEGIVIWSDHTPTEVEGLEGTKDKDVILIANRIDRHRVPRAPRPGASRWLCRVWVKEND